MVAVVRRGFIDVGIAAARVVKSAVTVRSQRLCLGVKLVMILVSIADAVLGAVLIVRQIELERDMFDEIIFIDAGGDLFKGDAVGYLPAHYLRPDRVV